MNTDGQAAAASATTTSDAPPPPPTPRRPRLGQVARAVQVRLRFVVVLAVGFLVVGRWDDFRNRWERLTRGLRGDDAGLAAVSSDTEYFCPMDPGVLSEWPGKCGVCNMPLVRRKRGDMAPLPDGVVARVQFAPYRLQLAGIRTAPVAYQPLQREAVMEGRVAAGAGPKGGVTLHVHARERDRAVLAVGQAGEVRWLGLATSGPSARIEAIAPDEGSTDLLVTLRADDPDGQLAPGQAVEVRVRRPVAELEPFRSQPTDPPPLRKGEPRSVYLCAEHAEVLRLAAGRCPVDGRAELEAVPLADNQRVGWWCPMHPKVAADHAGESCRECGGMTLVPRAITYRPASQVLAVPESAVIDTGSRAVVYVERMPGMFDGVEVTLGPRCGSAYPVASGLEPGQRVATAGAFLIDAETRLNPALASAYFGATRSERPAATAPTAAPAAAAPLPPALARLAESQKICPVTGKPLGSMGTPLAVDVAGRTVLVCCEGCRDPLVGAPEKYLARLKSRAPLPPGGAGAAATSP